MRAYRAKKFGGTEVLALDDGALPEPGPGEIRIAVRAAALHLADVAALAGERAPRPELPFTPGFEAAGLVTALGEGVDGIAVGDSVTGFLRSGGLAAEAVALAGLCAPLPSGFAFEKAAGLPMAYAGALMALKDRARVTKGQWVLVLGAGGQTGLAAVAVAKKLGARVIAAAASEDRRDAAEAQGADHMIDASAKALASTVMSLTKGAGAQVIFDPVGGDAFDAALGAAAFGARYIVAGFAAGRASTARVQALFARGIDLIGANVPAMAQHNPERAKKALEEVIGWAVAGKIKPRIAAQFRFADARHALEYVKARRDMGAVIVTAD